MADALQDPEIHSRLKQMKGWTLAENSIEKTFSFADYYRTLAFVNATAWISHGQDHHPDLTVGYNKVVVRYSTHSAGGVTEKDLDCARRVDGLI